MKGSFAGPAKGGGLPVEEVARLVAGYVQSVKGEFPDVIIGDIEYQSTERRNRTRPGSLPHCIRGIFPVFALGC